jgi:hypothetical protein
MADSALHTPKHQQNKTASAPKPAATGPDLGVSGADWVVQLQRQIGNRAVASMLTGTVQREGEGEGEAPAPTLPEQINALVERIEGLKPKLKEARVRIILGIRDGMPRGWMETPNTLPPILADIRKNNADFPIASTFDTYITRTKAIKGSGQINTATAAVDRMEAALNVDVTPYVEAWLDAQAQATWDKFDALVTAGDETKILSALNANYRKYTALGDLRAYYRSSHDQSEKATYGLSYDLTNTPLAVHLHSAGSGTMITAVSLKKRSDEYGQAVVFVKSLSSKAPSLLEKLVADIHAHEDSPRNVVLNIKNNGWRARWKRSDVR